MQLSDRHRRYLLIETAVSTVFNTAISALFAFLLAQGAPTVPLWGATGMAFDLLPTVFMITLVTTLIVTLLTRKRIRAGKVPPLGAGEGGWLGWAPRNAALRALVYAGLLALVLVPVSIAVLVLLGVHALPFHIFLPYKMIYGAALSILATPLIARAALAEPAVR